MAGIRSTHKLDDKYNCSIQTKISQEAMSAIKTMCDASQVSVSFWLRQVLEQFVVENIK